MLYAINRNILKYHWFLHHEIEKYEGKRRKKEETIPENSVPKKARILWDCLSPVCQGAKFGINRQPLSFYFIIPYFLNAAISCFSQLLNGFQIFFLNKGKSLCLIAFIFCFRFFHHLYMTDFPCMVQYLFTHRSKNVIQLLHIIAHIHGPVTDGLTSAKSK